MAVKPVKKKAGKAAARNVVALAPRDRTALLALEDSYDRPPDVSVPVLMQEGLELAGVVGKYRARLLGGTRLEKKLLDAIASRRATLDTTESMWRARRLQAAGSRELHDEAEALKRDAVATLRYFVADDATVQRRLDAIQEGTGLADFVVDLKRLSELLAEQAPSLKKADLPKNAATRARELSEQISEGAAGQSVDGAAAQLLSLRNRAFWSLREAMDEIRAAGRYAFRAEPKLLPLFRATRSVPAKAAKVSPLPAPKA